MDVRRELDMINRHFRAHHKTAGETIVWYEFDWNEPAYPTSSFPSPDLYSELPTYDDVYDEGGPGTRGRRYKAGVTIPVLLASENEDQKRAIPEGRQVMQTMDLFVSIKDMREAGISIPYEYRGHLNDIFLYDGRYYSVYNYRVRGRLRDDIFLLLQGMEIYLDQEMPNDPGPERLEVTSFPWPTSLPTVS